MAILESLDSVGALPDGKHVPSGKILSAVEERIGLAPGYAYEVLVDLAQSWTVPVPLVIGEGDFGSYRSGHRASFEYTDARLSRAGQVALAAERGAIAPVPVGIINGNTHREGTRPPFRPPGIIEAVRTVMSHAEVTDGELIDIVGPPQFPADCVVSGDLDALAQGVPAELRLEARVTISDDQGHVIIENISPNVTIQEAFNTLSRLGDARKLLRRESTLPGLAFLVTLPMARIRDYRDYTDHQQQYPSAGCLYS